MEQLFLNETFDGPKLDERLTWHHEPSRWSIDSNQKLLRVEPGSSTDYWQKTHYGFQADNGPFLAASVSGDWILSTHVRFSPAHQYDQAGLMVYLSPTSWIKTSVEYQLDRPSLLGAVVTNAGYSDWSTQPFLSSTPEIWLRIRREETDYIVESSSDGMAWNQIRMAHLLDDDSESPTKCGLYACCPKESGFVAEFLHFKIELGRTS